MGLYDFMIKYGLNYNDFTQMIYDLRGFVDGFNPDNIIKQTDGLYDDNEYKTIKNNPMGKTYMIDGQPMKIIYAIPVDRPTDGLPLWNITTDTGLELQEWYPEYEIK